MDNSKLKEFYKWMKFMKKEFDEDYYSSYEKKFKLVAQVSFSHALNQIKSKFEETFKEELEIENEVKN